MLKCLLQHWSTSTFHSSRGVAVLKCLLQHWSSGTFPCFRDVAVLKCLLQHWSSGTFPCFRDVAVPLPAEQQGVCITEEPTAASAMARHLLLHSGRLQGRRQGAAESCQHSHGLDGWVSAFFCLFLLCVCVMSAANWWKRYLWMLKIYSVLSHWP